VISFLTWLMLGLAGLMVILGAYAFWLTFEIRAAQRLARIAEAWQKPPRE
jgi:hypothetical protein